MELRDNLILRRSFDFAVMVVNYCLKMIEDKEYVISRQLMKCGTSVGANVEEAQGAISKAEFIAKMQIALKEARETNYWLRLIEKSNLKTYDGFDILLKESEDLRNILTSILKNSKS